MIRQNLIFTTLMLAACEAAPNDAPAESAKPPTTTSSSTMAATAWSEASLEPSLRAYENVRALLAADQADGLAGAANAVATATAKAKAGAPAKTAASLAEVEKAASALASSVDDGLEEARKHFGTLSRHTIALLVAHPKLRAGRHVFECPMAAGYGKWVQTSEELENPYMGKRMLQCGGKTEWSG